MRLLKYIIGIGIYPGLSKNLLLPVRTINTLAVVGTLGTVFAIGFSIWHADPWGLYLVPLLGFLCLGIGFKTSSYAVMLITGNRIIIDIWCRIRQSHLVFMLLPAIVFPFFIFSVEQKTTMLVTSIIVADLYCYRTDGQ